MNCYNRTRVIFDPEDISPLERFIPIYACVIISLGLLGNAFSINFFLKTQLVKNFVKYVITGIAICDCLTLLGFPIVYILKYWRVREIDDISELTCKLSSSFGILPFRMSLALLQILVLERLLAVCYPLKLKSIFGAKLKILAVLLVSILPLIRLIITALAASKREDDGKCVMRCGSVDNFSLLVIAYSLDVTFVGQNFLFLLVSNAVIFVVLKKRNTLNNVQHSVQCTRATKLMMGLSLLSLICIIPEKLFALIVDPSVSPDLFYSKLPYKTILALHRFLNLISFTHNSITFPFYLIQSHAYRKSFIELMTCGRITLWMKSELKVHPLVANPTSNNSCSHTESKSVFYL